MQSLQITHSIIIIILLNSIYKSSEYGEEMATIGVALLVTGSVIFCTDEFIYLPLQTMHHFFPNGVSSENVKCKRKHFYLKTKFNTCHFVKMFHFFRSNNMISDTKDPASE